MDVDAPTYSTVVDVWFFVSSLATEFASRGVTTVVVFVVVFVFVGRLVPTPPLLLLLLLLLPILLPCLIFVEARLALVLFRMRLRFLASLTVCGLPLSARVFFLNFLLMVVL